MFEVDPRKSPLDDIRLFEKHATTQDAIVMAESDIYRGVPNDLIFSKLYENVPFLRGEEVVGFGYPAQRLDKGTAEEFGTGLILPEQMPLLAVRGIYRELRIVPVVMNGIVRNRVVHALEEKSDARENIYFDPRPEPTYVNVCATGAKIYPAEPVDAHSLKKLEEENEELIGYYDRTMLENEDQEFGFTEKVKAIGEFINNRLRQEGYKQNMMNHQRISWLNAKKLLNGRKITAANFVDGQPGIDRGLKGQKFSDMDEEVEIVAGNLTVAEEYKRNIVDGSVEFSGKKELYVYGSVGVRPVTVPVSKILFVE